MSNDSQIKDNKICPRRILVIEDNHDSAEVLQTFLEINGHETVIRYSGESGLETAKQIAPDVIICDISLSGKMDGYEVAEEIRRHAQTQSVLLIALSGYGRSEDKEKSKAAGFDKHLTKPTDFDALVQLINSFDKK